MIESAFFDSNFWSAIVGAVVGGAISCILQIISMIAAARQKAEHDRQQSDFLGLSLRMKLMRIAGNLARVSEHIEECYRSKLAREGGEPWQFMTPLSYLPDQVKLDAAEMAVALSKLGPSIVGKLLQCETAHSNLLGSFAIYRERLSSLHSQLHGDVVGDVITSSLSTAEINALRPRFLTLNNLANQLRAHSKKEAALSANLLEEVGSALRAIADRN